VSISPPFSGANPARVRAAIQISAPIETKPSSRLSFLLTGTDTLAALNVQASVC